MRKLFSMLAVAVLSSGLVLAVKAAEEKTFKGEGACAKCSLNETTACQNAIKVTEGGKTLTYYLTKNKTANDFHKNLCKADKKIKVTGEVKKAATADTPGEITASKIEVDDSK
ncbi:MAG TPA: DUF6370 family protein [Isosphaeraceae bacterium]|nr:DUF6370 family protein [Isosphaeraceae bacterium]